jgi:type III pantothenate kinase
MNAVVDFGNSRVKIGYFEADKLLSVSRIAYAERQINAVDFQDVEHVLVSSVLDSVLDFTHLVAKPEQVLLLNRQTPLPIGNKYESKDTLGYDRIAAAAGAFQLFPQKNALIIDLGTAAKYDFIDATGNFQGGMIAPGRAMRFKALHTFTGRLPLLDGTKKPLLIGKTTAACIESGVLNGMCAEINGIIEEYQKLGEIQVIITGGDGVHFESQLKYPTFAAPNLVLEGLNSILRYNVYKN